MSLLNGCASPTTSSRARTPRHAHARQDMQFHYVGDQTWAAMLGQSVRLQPVPIQSLSELERARLQGVACSRLEERDLDIRITVPRETRKRRKSLRRKFDSFSKEKKDRESAPKAFGIPLGQVIANDRAHKQRQDALKESRRDCLDLEASVLRFRAEKSPAGLCSPPTGGVGLGGGGGGADLTCKPLSPRARDAAGRVQRRGGLSVDSISDLVESQSRLLEALQLSHPAELGLKKSHGGGGGGGGGGGSSEGGTQIKLSLNPIYRQVPRVLERCCCHIENHGLQTVGIFRVGSSKKRVRQLRECFDAGADVHLDEEHSVHDVAALLKEFLRDMPDPLLPRELYPAFLHANLLRGTDQLQYLQQLLFLLPACNCDTLLRLLTLLHIVQSYAQDTTGPHDEEIPGNKMTAANLAVIFGPNLLQGEWGGGGGGADLGIEDSSAIINVTLVLIQTYKRLFTVSAELQQEVLMSLIQTDPDVIDYLLRRKHSGSHVTTESVGSDGSSRSSVSSLQSGGRRDTGASLDSPFEPPAPLFPPDGQGGEISLSSEVFFNVLKLHQNRKRQEAANGGSEGTSGKSMRHIRQFHSHHNLLSLVHSSTSSTSSTSLCSSSSRLQGQEAPDREAQERRCARGFSLGGAGEGGDGVGGGGGGGGGEAGGGSVWVSRNAPAGEENKTSPVSNFWDFFTGKGSGSETVV